MKMKFRNIFLCMLALILLLPTSARADIGPKASVSIQFSGMENQTYYATLLSKRESTGPSTAYDGTELYARYHEGEEGYETWKIFVDYSDTDGYYFLQEFWKCEGDDTLTWGYYPPESFKILVYFPETDSFAVSEIHEQYAFDSYFTAELNTDHTTFSVKTSYDYTWELISLLARIVLTILIELAVAWLFHLRTKKQLTFVLVINLFTQIILNLLLNFFNFRGGPWAFTASYALFELVVFLIEAALYSHLKKNTAKPTHPIVFALCSNAASFAAGLWLAHIIPGIF